MSSIEIEVVYIEEYPRTGDPEVDAQFPGWFAVLRNYDTEEVRLSPRFETEREAEAWVENHGFGYEQ
jgi:hypothetical protein